MSLWLNIRGLAVKTKLLGPPVKTQKQLAAQVSERTGLYVDDSYISKVLTGRRKGAKVTKAIQEILDLPDGPNDST